jgi:DNA-binding NtrC family response regulator
LKRLEGYDYPGNIRELINVLERAVILSRDARVLDPEHIHFGAVSAQPDQPDFGLDEDTEADDFELRFKAGDDQLTDIRRKVILATLERYGGNQTLTAQKLGVSVRTIHNKLKNYDP